MKQTFEEAHKKLEEEEGKVMKELESVCSESEEALQKNLRLLRETREYSKILNKAGTKGKEFSRLMELNIVCSMEEQRRTMEELHRMMMTDLKVKWDSEGRKLSFTKTEDVYKRSLQAAKKGKLLTFHWRGGYLTREVLVELLDQMRKAGVEKGKVPSVQINWPQAVLRVQYADAGQESIVMDEANEAES